MNLLNLAIELVIISINNSPCGQYCSRVSRHNEWMIILISRITLLKVNHDQLYGKLIISRNITRGYEAEIALEQRLSEIEALNDSLR